MEYKKERYESCIWRYVGRNTFEINYAWQVSVRCDPAPYYIVQEQQEIGRKL